MTRLVKLTLKNFKSFKKAEIPISKGFTGIVGSNGSGKSNILDALLFVLGITSIKTLRASRLTELVNNDAKENYAKVDLVVKHGEKQYEISRMIDKQGKCVYRLDGKRTTLNEISSLLTELGIDVTGHNIVAQGDVTKVIEMSPLERRAIIDNIAGLSEFDEKKGEAIGELEKVDSRIKEATIILNERNAFLAELEQEMSAAKEFSELEAEKKSTKSTIIGRELYSLEKRKNEVEAEQKALEEQRAAAEARIAATREEMAKAKAEASELNRKIMTATEQLYATMGREFEEKKASLMLEQEKIELKKEVIVKTSEKIEGNRRQVEESEKEKRDFSEKVASFEHEHKELLKQLDSVGAKKAAIEKVVKSKNEDLRRLESELDSYNREIEESRKEIFELEVFARQWEKQKGFNEKKLAESIAEQESLAQEIASIDAKKKKIEEHGKGKDLAKEASALEKELARLLEQANKASALRESEEKAVAELKKALSKCPVCDARLEEKKKLELIEQKKKLIAEHEKKEKEHDKESEGLRKRIDDAKEKMVLVAKLMAEVTQEKAIQSRLAEAKKKIAALKQDLDAKAMNDQVGKRNRLGERLKAVLAKRDSSKEKLAAFRAQNIFEEYSAISRAFEELMNKKSLLEASLNDMSLKSASMGERVEMALIENAEMEEEVSALKKEIKEKESLAAGLEKEVLSKEKMLEGEKKKNALLMDEKEKLDRRIDKADKEIISESSRARKLELRLNEFAIERSRIEVRENDLKEESKAFEGAEQISGKSIDDLKERLAAIERKLADIGAVNMKAVDNFNDLKKEVDDIQQKAAKLAEERLVVLDMIDKIEVKRLNVFMACFGEINRNFQDMFTKFFNGEGNLTFSDPEKPLESGLQIDAKQKGGKLQSIDSMSGGEKTLTALAFMFAIQLYKPAPFYAFDEADAALDKENSLKMGNLVEMIAEKSQFVAVTHNDTITKKADQLIGVAKGKDGSSVIGLRMKNAQEKLEEPKNPSTEAA